MVKQPLISIIVPSYTMRRLGDIYELLRSVKDQTYPRIETVIVVERSMMLFNRLEEFARENDDMRLKIVFNDGEPGASAARNLGIKHARGEILAFVDDDVVLFPDWAHEMVKTYTDGSIIGVTGLSYPLWGSSPADWLPEELYWIISCTGWSRLEKVTDVRNIWLQNASFRREAFKSAGLIDLDLGPRDAVQGFKGKEFKDGIISEEIELSMRVRKATGKRIVCNPHVKIYHKVYDNRLKVDYIARWSYWTGFTKHKTKQLYPRYQTGLLSQENELLRRILTGLIPDTLRRVHRHPFFVWRRLSVTFLALFFVAAGYCVHAFSPADAHRKLLIEQEGVE